MEFYTKNLTEQALSVTDILIEVMNLVCVVPVFYVSVDFSDVI